MNILVIGEKLFTDYALQALDDTAHMVDVYYWDGTFGPELFMDSGINDYDCIVVMFNDDKLSADITSMIEKIVTNENCTVFNYILWPGLCQRFCHNITTIGGEIMIFYGIKLCCLQ